MYASFCEKDVTKITRGTQILSSQAIAAGRVSQKNSLVMKTIAVLLIAQTLKFSSATSILCIPAQLKQEISGKVLDVLLTPYSWQ